MADEAAKWGGLKLEVPPPVMEPIITAINDFLELMVAALDIALIILDIAKVFIVGLLSPLLAVIDAIIQLLESLANDLSKLGLYIHVDKFSGDGKDFWKHAEKCRGGYQSFESRCFNWLIDTGDPKRPDFSTASGVLGLFFYASVDIEEFMKLVRIIQQLGKLFGKSVDQHLQVPTGLEYELKTLGGAFGMQKFGLTSWTESAHLPEIAGLSWGHAASPSSPLGIALPPLPPPCSVIEISTTPEGYLVGTSRKKDNGTYKNAFVEAPIKVGGGPLRIYGGTQTLRDTEGAKQSPKGNNGIWFLKSPDDMTPIYLSEWIDAEDVKGAAIGQNQIVIHHGSAMNAFFPDFTYDLDWEDCPYGIKSISNGKPTAETERAREVFVRISSANKAPANQEPNKKLTASDSEGVSGWKIRNLNSTTQAVDVIGHPDTAERSPASAPLKVKFPSNSQKVFQQMIRNAAIIAYMCRGSIDVGEEENNKPSGFEPLAKKLAIYLPRGEKAYTKDSSLFGSRMKMCMGARRISDDFQNVSGHIPDAVIDILVENHAKNLNFHMGSDTTINGESVPSFAQKNKEMHPGWPTMKWGDEDAEDLYSHCKGLKENVLGVHLNYKYFVDDSDADLTAAVKMGMNTDPVYEMLTFMYRPTGAGSRLTTKQIASYSSSLPVFMGLTPGSAIPSGSAEWVTALEESHAYLAYAREMFSLEQLQSAQAVLQIATNLSGTGQGWIALRPLEGLMEPFEDFIESAIAFMKTVKEGLMAIIQQILDYIRMIEARIMELQQLIRKIQSILAMFADFVVSADLHMLVVSGAGTQGLTSEFMSAEDKPSDGPDAYGTGVVVVAGGLPLIIVDLLKAIFAAGDKPGGGDGAGDGDDAGAADLLADEGA